MHYYGPPLYTTMPTIHCFILLCTTRHAMNCYELCTMMDTTVLHFGPPLCTAMYCYPPLWTVMHCYPPLCPTMHHYGTPLWTAMNCYPPLWDTTMFHYGLPLWTAIHCYAALCTSELICILNHDWLASLSPFQMLYSNQSQWRKLGLIIMKVPKAPLHQVARCYAPARS